MTMNTRQAAVNDPILTAVAQGYKNSTLVGNALFPDIPVNSRSGRILTFGREAFRLYNSTRAPGANVKRVSDSYTWAEYVLDQKALEGSVPIEIMEEAQEVPGINMASVAISQVMARITLGREYDKAQLATNAANYSASNKVTLSGTSQWSDYANSDPIGDIETAKTAVRQAVGIRPNTILMGGAVFDKLKHHPAIVDRMKYTGRDVATPDILAALFGVQRVVVGDAVFDDGSGLNDVWGKNVVVAYTNTATAQDMGAPTFGYNYQLNGGPVAEAPYFNRDVRSWQYPVIDDSLAKIVGADAGYLISAAVA